MRIVGVETEYGVSAPGSDLSVEVLSELVIRAVEPSTLVDAPPADVVADATVGPEDLAASRVIGNGARAYVDHAHPEYSSPECSSPSQLVAYDRAGDRLFADAARRAAAAAGVEIRLYRNTTDGKGASYGRHENHLVTRQTPWQRIVEVVTGFLVARVPLVGAGRVGLGQRGEQPGYQISQRADFLVTPIGLQTTHDRPILNTRDEPHADPAQWRRLHVITGDPAWNEHQSWLTVGTLALVLAATEADDIEPVRWRDPVAALHAFSHDPTLTVAQETAEGRRLTCLDALESTWADCAAHVHSRGDVLGAETGPVLAAWRALLDDLRAEVSRTADRLDWVAKQQLLEGLQARTGAGWDDPRLAAVDLLWADLDRTPARGLSVREASARVVSDQDVETAMTTPPATTRAYLRGTLVSRFPDQVVTAGWDDMLVRRRDGRLRHIPMPDPWGFTQQQAPSAAVAVDLDQLLTKLESAGAWSRGTGDDNSVG